MPIIPYSSEDRRGESEGMASLQVGSAHLSTLLAATDSLDSKAMFLVALNLALYVAYVGAVVGLSLSALALLAPGVFLGTVLVLGWSCVRPRTILQFNNPAELLQNRDGAWSDHFLSWFYIEAIAEASAGVESEIERKVFLIRLIAVGSLLHGAALALCSVLWMGG